MFYFLALNDAVGWRRRRSAAKRVLQKARKVEIDEDVMDILKEIADLDKKWLGWKKMNDLVLLQLNTNFNIL